MNPIDPQTLQAIGGQKTAAAASQFAQTMQSVYSVAKDIKDREMQRELQTRQLELTDLNIASKKHQAVGNAALSVLTMLDETKNPANFIEQYQTFRANTGAGVIENLPQTFKDVGEARMWAVQQVAQADKLIPYLELQRKGAGIQQWQAIAQILAIPESERSQSQKDFLKFYGKADNNIYINLPSKASKEDTIMALQNVTLAGEKDTPVLDLLDEKSKAAFISAVSNLTDKLVAESGKNGVPPMDREAARQQAIESLSSRIQKKESLLQSLPWIGKYADADYVFVTDPIQMKAEYGVKEEGAAPAAQANPAVPEEAKALEPGQTVTINGTQWRRNPQTGKLQSRKVK